MALPLLFGANIDPSTSDLEESYQRAALADQHNLDLITIQDHPYQKRFLDTWTLLTILAAKTQRVHVGTNVANLPLRPPAMLAKMAASLDVITGGRVELGLGAGAFWPAIAAFGGIKRTPAEAYTAFEEALHILRGMWDNAGHSFTYKGTIYQVQGAQPGPAPAHRIPIWVGASGPKMLKLTGRMADGLLVSTSYQPPENLPRLNHLIDEGAEEVGRSPDDIRRGYNIMGVIDLNRRGGKISEPQKGVLQGSIQAWIEELSRYYHDYRQDTFLFWPIGDNPLDQLRAFAQEIVPAVKAGVTQTSS